MSEQQTKHNHQPENSGQGEQDLLTLVKKIQQHLNFLEKKIDLLVGQAGEKSFRPKSFARPFRPGGGGHSHRPEGRDRGHGPSSGGDRPFSQGRPFDRPHGGGGGEHRKFDPRKKPFFKHRKERG